jgi:hypothetical protein
MKKALLFALALIAATPVDGVAQDAMDVALMNEIYEAQTCRDDQRNDRRVCEYNLNDELAFETTVYDDRSVSVYIYRVNMHTREGSPFRSTRTGGYWLSQVYSSDGSVNCLRLWKMFDEGSRYDGRGTSVHLSVSTNRLFAGFDGSENCVAAEREFRNGG